MESLENPACHSQPLQAELKQSALLFEEMLQTLSVRAYNVINSYRQQFDNKHQFLIKLASITPLEVFKLKNCGKKTATEILTLSRAVSDAVNQELSNNYEYLSSPGSIPETSSIVREDKNGVTLAPNIDSLLPIVEMKIEALSIKANRAIASLFIRHGFSLGMVYKTIKSATFNPLSVKGVGAKSIPEINQFLDYLCDYLEQFPDQDSVNAAISKNKYSSLLKKESTIDSLFRLQNTLGYFPLFKLVDDYLAEQDEESKMLLRDCIRIRPNTSIVDKKDLADKLGLTKERIRQKVGKLLDTLTKYFESLSQFDFWEHNPYLYQMRYVNEEINRVEGANFSLEFVNWVLGVVFPQDVTLIGDVNRTLTSYYDKGDILCLVPTELCKYCNFKGFIEDVYALIEAKRVDDTSVSIHNLIVANLKVNKDYCEDHYSEIKYSCRSIIYLHFKLDIDYGNIIFKANAYKPLPDLIYSIILAHGSPMTSDEIAEEINYNYPERAVNSKSVSQNVLRHSGVVAIGRTGTYTLSAWHDGEFRGGTIRGIVAECLSKNEPTIVLFKKVVSYVNQYRPTTNEKSVMSNIALEQTGAFTFFFNNGKRYLGLSENEYPIDFFPVIKESKSPEANSIWYPKMYKFVKKKGHFPFTGYSEEETKLSQFWAKQSKRYDADQLDEHSRKYYEKILMEFGHMSCDKKEYEWKRNLERIRKICRSSDTDSFSRSERKWLADSFIAYSQNTLEQWQKDDIDSLLRVMRRRANKNTDNV